MEDNLNSKQKKINSKELNMVSKFVVTCTIVIIFLIINAAIILSKRSMVEGFYIRPFDYYELNIETDKFTFEENNNLFTIKNANGELKLSFQNDELHKHVLGHFLKLENGVLVPKGVCKILQINIKPQNTKNIINLNTNVQLKCKEN